MTHYKYWCVDCGKSFSEVDSPSECDECGGFVDHDEVDDDPYYR